MIEKKAQGTILYIQEKWKQLSTKEVVIEIWLNKKILKYAQIINNSTWKMYH